MKIDVNEQSSIRIETESEPLRVIYCDPFRLTSESHDADIILITHSHFDHFSPEDIAKAASSDTVFIAPRDVDISDKTVLLPGDNTELLGIGITAVPAYNIIKPFHPKLKKWVGYILNIEGRDIYITGDTDATPEAKNVKCDTILLPIGGKYTMDCREAAALVNKIMPDTAIPTHYGSVIGSKEDYDTFADKVNCKTEKKLWI